MLTRIKTLLQQASLKIAFFAVAANIALTIFKFILFFLSRSIAIWAEAWHSFSDIATSILVVFALLFSHKDTSSEKKVTTTLECIAALIIGIFLLVVSFHIGWRCITGKSSEISRPLISGIFFIIFSICSFIISSIELKVGEKEHSPGLIADAFHSRADMLASLLTGVSLLMYKAGFNIDRFTACIIMLLIFTVALETIINAILSYRKRKEDELFSYRSFKLVMLLSNPRLIPALFTQVRTKIKELLPSRVLQHSLKLLIALAPITLLCFYFSTSVFVVTTREEAIIERLGRPLSLGKTLKPGLHCKLPWPFDKAIKIDVDTIRSMNIGNTVTKDQGSLLWTEDHGTELPFLSGDDTFFYPYITLHYRISSLYNFLYHHQNSVEITRQLTYRLAANYFAQESFDNITIHKRSLLEKKLQSGLQENIDTMQAGIEIVNVNFRDIHPPISVAGSFEMVIAGYQTKQQLINKALKYRNEKLPEARSIAFTQGEEAKAYIIEQQLRSSGDADRFLLALPKTYETRSIARSKHYFKAMQDLLQNREIILIDPSLHKTTLWLNFDSLPEQ